MISNIGNMGKGKFYHYEDSSGSFWDTNGDG